ncbi:MAG: flavodoxin family protein [Bacilli bacterium]|jgi:multimeric flavodoxin WrbA|nr:flavodoxin family protein [Bacilli bacterium]
MNKKIVIVSASLRSGSNSETLAQEVARGASENGNSVVFLSLKDKDIRFCRGCLACQKTGKCAIKDDVASLLPLISSADVLVFATPIYYYEMSGQLKTFLDRLNPLYGTDYRFRDVYFLSVSADESDEAAERAIHGLQGWIDCFPNCSLKATIHFGGINDPLAAKKNQSDLKKAYDFGKAI